MLVVCLFFEWHSNPTLGRAPQEKGKVAPAGVKHFLAYLAAEQVEAPPRLEISGGWGRSQEGTWKDNKDSD